MLELRVIGASYVCENELSSQRSAAVASMQWVATPQPKFRFGQTAPARGIASRFLRAAYGAPRTLTPWELVMPDYDLAIRGGTITTASDTFRADVAVRDGRIAAIAERVDGAAREIDATGLIVMPGGIDSHVHLSQPAFGGPKMADDFLSGTRSAIAGGNTTVLPFALQPRGTSLRGSVMEYHKEANGKALADYGFHLIITDPLADRARPRITCTGR